MCEKQSSEPFWERSWKAVNAASIADYAVRPQPEIETIISHLKARGAAYVCDAGCGCGVCSLALAANGFQVSGFDVSADAVALAQELLTEQGYCAHRFHVADIRKTGYADGTFDAVVARDVIDHMPVKDGAAAVEELLRIVRPGGSVLLTLDETDSEYESEPHSVSPDGDYLYTAGKWVGMVFHPYSPHEIEKLTRGHPASFFALSESGYLLILEPTGMLQALQK